MTKKIEYDIFIVGVIAMMSSSKIINLRKLYYTDFIIEDVFAMRQIWKKNVLFQRPTGRPRTGIIFLNNCNGIYTDKSGESFLAPKKSVVCLPYGSIYTCLNLECANNLNDAIMIEFNAIENNNIITFSDKPFLVKDVNTLILADLFENVIKAHDSSLHSMLATKTSIYNLLLYICKEKTQKYQKRFSIISAGIELMESDTICEHSIEEIARLCNVSSCHFRRLFKEYSGKTPLEYRIDMRLNAAKKMLENGEVGLGYIVETLNFESVSYFCKLFKKKLGVTPNQYKSNTKTSHPTIK